MAWYWIALLALACTYVVPFLLYTLWTLIFGESFHG